MNKKTLLQLLLAILLLPSSLFAEDKAMDAFIARIKQTNKFVPINDIWNSDRNFDKSALLQ